MMMLWKRRFSFLWDPWFDIKKLIYPPWKLAIPKAIVVFQPSTFRCELLGWGRVVCSTWWTHSQNRFESSPKLVNIPKNKSLKPLGFLCSCFFTVLNPMGESVKNHPPANPQYLNVTLEVIIPQPNINICLMAPHFFKMVFCMCCGRHFPRCFFAKRCRIRRWTFHTQTAPRKQHRKYEASAVFLGCPAGSDVSSRNSLVSWVITITYCGDFYPSYFYWGEII